MFVVKSICLGITLMFTFQSIDPMTYSNASLVDVQNLINEINENRRETSIAHVTAISHPDNPLVTKSPHYMCKIWVAENIINQTLSIYICNLLSVHLCVVN